MTEVWLMQGAAELREAVDDVASAASGAIAPSAIRAHGDDLRRGAAPRRVFVVTAVDTDDPEVRRALEHLALSGDVVRSPGRTGGTACSALLAIDHLDPADEVVVWRGSTGRAAVHGIVALLRSDTAVEAAWTETGAEGRWRERRTDGRVHARDAAPGPQPAPRELAWFRCARDLLEASCDAVRQQPPGAGPVPLARLFDSPAAPKQPDRLLPPSRGRHADRSP
jgi:hypothetical protein